ncbi:MAG: hypothetical protein ABI367_07720 [Mucilaginibacter sp.]
MENYNQTAGNGSRSGQQRQNQNKQQNQSNLNRQMSPKQNHGKKSVYIKDMPEIKPEINEGGI